MPWGESDDHPGGLGGGHQGCAEGARDARATHKQNVYALAYRTRTVKTASARAAKIERFVAMLARGETIYPQKAK